jgi:hypothetical protein
VLRDQTIGMSHYNVRCSGPIGYRRRQKLYWSDSVSGLTSRRRSPRATYRLGCQLKNTMSARSKQKNLHRACGAVERLAPIVGATPKLTELVCFRPERPAHESSYSTTAIAPGWDTPF